MSGPRPWPPVVDQALLDRLMLSDEAFEAMLADLAETLMRGALTKAAFGGASMTVATDRTPEEAYQQAISYPWGRPAGSFVLAEDGTSAPLTAEAVAEFLETSPEPRYPMLAIGANGAPARLAGKLSHLPDGHRSVIAFGGYAADLDIGPAAHLTAYGALPATPFSSPGTQVRATVLWLDATQLTALTWTEVSYHLGRLDPISFTPDEAGATIDHALLYVSRWGNLTIDGEPIALSALPAKHRTARPLEQVDLLEHVARLTPGAEHDGRSLVEQLIADPLSVLATSREALRPHARAFDAPGWSTYRM